MSTTALLKQVAAGCAAGLTSLRFKAYDDTVKVGGTDLLAAMCQMGAVYQAVCIANEALGGAGRAPLSLTARSIICAMPLALALAKQIPRLPQSLYAHVQAMQNRVGTAVQLANIASLTSRAARGERAAALPALALLGLGFLERNDLLSSRMHTVFQESKTYLRIATGCFAASKADKVFALSDLYLCVQKTWNRCFPQPIRQKPTIQSGTLTSARLQAILQQPVWNWSRLAVDRNYVHVRVETPPPEVDINTLLTEFSQLAPWPPSVVAELRTRLQEDERYREQTGNATRRATDDEIIEYVRSGIKSLVDSASKSGTHPVNYPQLRNLLKIIADHVRNEPDLERKRIILVELGVEGGYCAPRQFEAASKLVGMIREGRPDIPLSERVFSLLGQMRLGLLQEMIRLVLTNFRIPCYLHIHNFCIRCWGPPIGVRTAGADNDVTAQTYEESPVDKVLDRLLLGQTTERFWTELHTPEAICEMVRNEIGTPSLPRPDVYVWWNEWIQRQALSDADKEALTNELQNRNSLMGQRLTEPGLRGAFDLRFVRAMLIDMGILKFTSP